MRDCGIVCKALAVYRCCRYSLYRLPLLRLPWGVHYALAGGTSVYKSRIFVYKVCTRCHQTRLAESFPTHPLDWKSAHHSGVDWKKSASPVQRSRYMMYGCQWECGDRLQAPGEPIRQGGLQRAPERVPPVSTQKMQTSRFQTHVFEDYDP